MPEQTDIYISSFPDAESITNADKVTGLQGNANKNFTFSTILAWFVNAVKSAFVPVSRTINGVTLDTNITLTAQDVGARPNTWTPSAADVGLGNVANERQYSALNPPPLPTPSDIGAQDTIIASGILKGNGSGGVTAAQAGTDYQAPLAAGTDYATPAQLADKANQSQLAYVETGTTASRAYAVGEYFCWNGLLYRVKTAISSGGTFTPGTNCETTTVGEEIQKKALFSTTSSSPVVLSFGPNTRAIIFATSTNAVGRGIYSTSTNASSTAAVSALVSGNAITMTSSGSSITVSSSTNVVYEILMLAGNLPTIS